MGGFFGAVSENDCVVDVFLELIFIPISEHGAAV
jgi:hypothetical protein